MIKLAARGVVPKWLRGRIANALFAGSIPADASTANKKPEQLWLGFFYLYYMITGINGWPRCHPGETTSAH